MIGRPPESISEIGTPTSSGWQGKNLEPGDLAYFDPDTLPANGHQTRFHRKNAMAFPPTTRVMFPDA